MIAQFFIPIFAMPTEGAGGPGSKPRLRVGRRTVLEKDRS